MSDTLMCFFCKKKDTKIKVRWVKGMVFNTISQCTNCGSVMNIPHISGMRQMYHQDKKQFTNVLERLLKEKCSDKQYSQFTQKDSNQESLFSCTMGVISDYMKSVKDFEGAVDELITTMDRMVAHGRI